MIAPDTSEERQQPQPRHYPVTRLRMHLKSRTPSPGVPLPPKRLEVRSTQRIRLVLGSLTSSILIALFATLIHALWSLEGGSPFYIDYGLATTSTCDELKASGPERLFIINARLPRTFSYAQARMLDITWDVVVGQLGKYLHAWILYAFVISPNLTLLLGKIAIPYRTIAALSFSPTSIWTIMILIRSLSRSRKWYYTASLVWHVFAICYVISFTSLWSATTGYLNPMQPRYQMPDGTLVGQDQLDAVTLCHALSDPELFGNETQIIESGNLQQLSDAAKSASNASTCQVGFNSTNTFPSSVTILWPAGPPNATSFYSGDFLDLVSYTATKQVLANELGFLISYLDSFTDPSGPSTCLRVANANRTDYWNQWISNWDFTNSTAFDRSCYNGEAFDVFPNTITSYQHDWRPYTVIDFISSLDNTNELTGSVGRQQSNSSHWKARNFTLDPNIIASGVSLSYYNRWVDAIPYNSTLNFNGTVYDVPAPFLDFSAPCKAYSGTLTYPLDVCLCHNHQVIPYVLDENHIVCIDSIDGYQWGISSTILIIAAFLEMIFLVGCWLTWLDANLRSQLVRRGYSGQGTLRRAFDLVEATRDALGPHIVSAYTDKELQAALDKCGSAKIEWRDGERKVLDEEGQSTGENLTLSSIKLVSTDSWVEYCGRNGDGTDGVRAKEEREKKAEQARVKEQGGQVVRSSKPPLAAATATTPLPDSRMNSPGEAESGNSERGRLLWTTTPPRQFTPWF